MTVVAGMDVILSTLIIADADMEFGAGFKHVAISCLVAGCVLFTIAYGYVRWGVCTRSMHLITLL